MLLLLLRNRRWQRGCTAPRPVHFIQVRGAEIDCAGRPIPGICCRLHDVLHLQAELQALQLGQVLAGQQLLELKVLSIFGIEVLVLGNSLQH